MYVIAIKNAHEALEYLESLHASSEDDLSDDEDFISSGRLVILPPNNEGNEDSDSGFDKERWRLGRWKWVSPKQRFKQKLTFSWWYCWS